MAGIDDLGLLLAGLDPALRQGEFVLVSLAEAPDAAVEALIREDEGVTCVVTREVADGHGWQYDAAFAWVTLRVHSSLAAVGLTAAVSAELAAAGIPANMLAGYFHDHVLVPVDRAGDALAALRALAVRSRSALQAPSPGMPAG